ncbi:hypothetical protein ACFE04_031839 [Oxalis oulophora]
MSSSSSADEPDLVCQLDNVQGIVDALSAVRWKRHQDAVIELSEHGVVLIVEDSCCLQAKVYLQKEIFVRYEYHAQGRPRFGVSLGLFVDCLNTFSVPGQTNTVEIRYPGPDMELLLKNQNKNSRNASAALKEAIDDLEWPGANIQIILQPDPPSVTFRGEGHGDLQIDFMYYANTDLLITFQCDHQVCYRYKYKFLKATTSNIPNSVTRDNRGSKLTIGRGGLLKVQHLVSVATSSIPHPHIDSAGYQQPSRIAYIEFFVKPLEDVDNE